MHRVTVIEFKAKCQELLREPPDEGLVITRRGERIAVIFPVCPTMGDLIGSAPYLIPVNGTDPLLSTEERWDVAS